MFVSIATHAATPAETDGARVLFDFRKAGAGNGWNAVNDGVMGGLSRGGPDFSRGLMRFSGNLSLEYNGGFSSIRKRVNLDLSEFTGIRLRVKGDGRTYQARMETDARFGNWAVSYSGDFATRKGEWMEVDVPFTSLSQSFRGRNLTAYPFDPAKIKLVGLILADKNPGPFAIDVEWIQAYRATPSIAFPASNRKKSDSGPAPGNSELALDETFDDGPKLGADWIVKAGKWNIVDGALRAQAISGEQKMAAASRVLSSRNAVYELNFRFASEGGAFHLGFDSIPVESGENAPLFSIVITPGSWKILKGADQGTSREDPEATLARRESPFKPGEWHHLRVTTWGPYVTATVNRDAPLKASHRDFNAGKSSLVFRNAGGVEMDDLKVWKEKRRAAN